MLNIKSKKLVISLAIALATPLPLFAAGLEEVVVTARKKEESLQDVPVAVQAVSGDFLEEKGIIDVQILAPYTPNFSYATAVGAADLLFMRGVGNFGAGPQFEPSVGQVFDGYFISRSRLGRTAFLDLAQVEVLKGPQGAIIGKNTSLGAINITPAKPSEEFEARVSGGHGWGDLEGPEFSAMVNGAISDTVRARFAIERKDQDGNVETTSPLAINDTAGGNDSTAIRLTVQADLSDTLSSELLLQTSDVTKAGKPRDVIWCPDTSRALHEAAGINCERDQTTAAVAYNEDGSVQLEELTIDTNVFGLRFDWDLGDLTFTSMTGYSDYEIVDVFDSDQNELDWSQFINDEEYDQLTQEFRISGENDSLNYIAGLFYMDNTVDFLQQTNQPSRNRQRNQISSVDTETISAFGQMDYNLSDKLVATLGLRWTAEDRDGEAIQYPTLAFSGDDPFDASVIGCGGGPTACTELDPADNFPSTLRDSISEDKLSGNASIKYLLDTGMVYGSYANGTKSGGFAVASALTPDAFVFDGETTDSFEIGGKHELADNTVRFNWALYYMQIDGLQTAALDPTVSVPVNVPVNADVISQGLEVELTWVPTDNLTITWAAAYTDSTFDDFLGDCWFRQSEAEGCVGGFQDLDGVALPLTPETNSVLGADYVWELDGGMTLQAGANWIYTGDYTLQLDQHPEGTQDSANKFDLSLVLSGDHGDNNWKFALVGRNITDEITYQFGATPPPIIPGTGGDRQLNAFPELGQVITAKFTYSWF